MGQGVGVADAVGSFELVVRRLRASGNERISSSTDWGGRVAGNWVSLLPALRWLKLGWVGELFGVTPSTKFAANERCSSTSTELGRGAEKAVSVLGALRWLELGWVAELFEGSSNNHS